MSARPPSLLRLAVLVAGLLAVALIRAACGSGDGGVPSPPPTAQGAGGGAATSSPQPTATAEDCGLTVGTTEGPYYVTGTPELKDGELNYSGLSGDPIRISGHVYAGEDASSPIAGAKIEIWQTDADGAYHPEGNGDVSQYGEDEVALRGYVVSDETGAYSFESVYPGYYEGRVRHIHVRASADGLDAVATQIIVPSKPGDGTTSETDGIAESLPACNFVEFAEQDGVQAGTFDFHLEAD